MIYTWALDPVAFYVAGWPVRWYGLAYGFGFLGSLFAGWKVLRYIKKESIFGNFESFQDLFFWAFFCGVLGGRVGHFLFFDPVTLWQDPFEVFKVWHGGMSIQGGLLGGTLGGFFLCRKKGVPLIFLSDLVGFLLPFPLFLGRIANFINGELVGIPTSGTWGVIFPQVDELPRHVPVLYEAGGHFVLALLAFFLLRHLKSFWFNGFFTGFFLVGYGGARFFIEYLKAEVVFIGPFTSGQWICLVMVFVGATLFFSGKNKVLFTKSEK